jgi:hypothetical protein
VTSDETQKTFNVQRPTSNSESLRKQEWNSAFTTKTAEFAEPQNQKLLCDLRVLRGELQVMKITKNIGMLLLAVYLIIDGLLGFGVNFGPAIFLLYLIALGAGVFILIGK